MAKEITPPADRIAAGGSTGTVRTARLGYITIQDTLQSLALARGSRGEAEALRTRWVPYWHAAGVDPDQVADVPCSLIRAATLCLRKWQANGPVELQELWGAADDAVLTAAWRDAIRITEQ